MSDKGLASSNYDYVPNGYLIQEVDEPFEDEEPQIYNCETCGTNFTSLEEHIKLNHPDQEVVLQVEDENLRDEDNIVEDIEEEEVQEELVNTIYDPDLVIKAESIEIEADEFPEMEEELYETEYLDEDYLDPSQDSHLSDTASGAAKLEGKRETIHVESCIDKDGRLYNRKIVKIQKFWENDCFTVPSNDRNKSQELEAEKIMYKCSECDTSYQTQRSLTSHMRTHRKPKKEQVKVPADKAAMPQKFDCEICNTIFTTNKSLRLHMRMHDPIKQKTIEESIMEITGVDDSDTEREYFHCDVCNKDYDKKFYTIHMKMHSSDPNYHCTICNKKFTSQLNLTMHIKAHQETKQPKPNNKEAGTGFECSYCGRIFGRPHEKVKHERIHTGEKPHICEICGKSFRVSYCLTLHMRTHTGARPYVCPHCNKRFKAHSVYNHHLQTHSDNRPYQCPFCPKAFKTSVQLAGHKNSHTKPFSCTECNRPFATLFAVRSHMETHKKPNHNLKHKCVICGATYARSFALRDHIKEQHSDIADANQYLDENIISNVITVNFGFNDEDDVKSAAESILPDNDDGGATVILNADDFDQTEEVVTDWIK